MRNPMMVSEEIGHTIGRNNCYNSDFSSSSAENESDSEEESDDGEEDKENQGNGMKKPLYSQIIPGSPQKSAQQFDDGYGADNDNYYQANANAHGYYSRARRGRFKSNGYRNNGHLRGYHHSPQQQHEHHSGYEGDGYYYKQDRTNQYGNYPNYRSGPQHPPRSHRYSQQQQPRGRGNRY